MNYKYGDKVVTTGRISHDNTITAPAGLRGTILGRDIDGKYTVEIEGRPYPWYLAENEIKEAPKTESYEGWTMYSPVHNCYFGRAAKDDYQSYHEPFCWEVRSILTKTKEEIVKIFNECKDPFYGGKHSWGFEPIHIKIELTRTK